jgi:hypothetical protein
LITDALTQCFHDQLFDASAKCHSWMHGEKQCGEVVQMVANLIKRLAIQLTAHDSPLVRACAQLLNNAQVRRALVTLTADLCAHTKQTLLLAAYGTCIDVLCMARSDECSSVALAAETAWCEHIDAGDHSTQSMLTKSKHRLCAHVYTLSTVAMCTPAAGHYAAQCA